MNTIECPNCKSKFELKEVLPQEKLKPGDKVEMVDCLEAEKHTGKVWEVGCAPWNLCGTEVVLLMGYRGGFDVGCLRKVEEHVPGG